MHLSPPPPPRGFTLIELSFAILVLSSSLIVLLGLQTSTIKRALRDQEKTQAMMLARRVLAEVERDETGVQGQEKATLGSIEEILESIGGEPDPEDKDFFEQSKQYQISYNVELIGIPDVNESAMKRITLNVSWSDSSLDRLEVYYFIPNIQQSIAPKESDDEEG